MKNYLIVGYGGIGKAVANKLIRAGESVTVVSRKNLTTEPGILQVDFNELDNFFAQQIPDYVINTIGVLHDSEHQPEKTLQQLDETWLNESMRINVMPTAILAQKLDQAMQRDYTVKMLSLSARVSSMDDNKLGGWYSYRMSKAALNMLIKNIAIEWSFKHPNAGIYAYHPGTVDTELSQPFQARVPEGKLFSPELAADYLLAVLHKLTIKDSGNLFDWQGEQLKF